MSSKRFVVQRSLLAGQKNSRIIPEAPADGPTQSLHVQADDDARLSGPDLADWQPPQFEVADARVDAHLQKTRVKTFSIALVIALLWAGLMWAILSGRLPFIQF